MFTEVELSEVLVSDGRVMTEDGETLETDGGEEVMVEGSTIVTAAGAAVFVSEG